MFLQAKECQRLPTSHQRLCNKHEADSPWQPSERTKSAHTLISTFYPPEPWEYVSVVWVTWFVVLCYSSPRKQVHPHLSWSTRTQVKLVKYSNPGKKILPLLKLSSFISVIISAFFLTWLLWNIYIFFHFISFHTWFTLLPPLLILY